ncbi:MAG: hypothetical protein PUP93_17715 [Rhizonema sp. NSF051]|nr:hypothetical protein [Rhizonema sp. NSF051]
MKLKSKFLAGLLGLAIDIALQSLAGGATLNPHSYWLYSSSNSLPIHGVYFVSQNTGEDLQNPNPTSSQIITKETWLNFSTANGGEWIELGTIYGNLYSSFYSTNVTAGFRGGFIGFNGCAGLSASQCSSYSAFTDGTATNNNLTGVHSFIARKKTDGSGNYQTYIDGNAVAMIEGYHFTVANPIYADLGIESSDSTNTFTNGTVAYDWWVVDPNNETNINAGWFPLASSQVQKFLLHNNYLNGDVSYQYPYDNGSSVPGGRVTQSNRLTYTHP